MPKEPEVRSPAHLSNNCTNEYKRDVRPPYESKGRGSLRPAGRR
jgi:hypothetical protein